MTGIKAEGVATGKALAASLVLAALMAACLVLLAARPAYAATVTVNSTGDAGDNSPGNGSCFTGVLIQGSGPGFVRECTLRAAIEETNANDNDATVVDAIGFNVPGAGPHTISPTTPLPRIAEPVTIDGYTQPGASLNTATTGTNAVLKIMLNGSNAPNAPIGLWVRAESTVKGLVVNGFSTGVVLDSFEGFGGTLEGCFIGTDAAGNAAVANRHAGVYASGVEQVIGGQALAARNLISGNGRGIEADPGGHFVEGNLIGTKKDGTTDLGNGTYGVKVEGSDHIVSRNTIAFNGDQGVLVASGVRNRMFSNSIHHNAGSGIDLIGDGPTPNDPKDPDRGPNDLQNFPVITGVTTVGTTTTISGRLNSIPDETFELQFFSNPSGDEGQRFIGEQRVTTDANGDARFTFAPGTKVAVGRTVTATTTGAEGSTSEFSAPRKVTQGVIGP